MMPPPSSSPPRPDETARALRQGFPLLVNTAGILGALALVGGLLATLQQPPVRVPPAVIVERPAPAAVLPLDVLPHAEGLQLLARRGPPAETADDPRCGAGWRRLHWKQPSLSVCVSDAGRVRVLSTSITPITAITDANTGFSYGGDSWNVLCTIAGGSATLYPASHASTGNWKVWQGFPCTISSTVAGQGSCSFPAPLQGSSLTWNVFTTGAGTVSACTAEGRSGQVPPPPISPSSGSSGTVTSIDCTTGLTCTPDPITADGTIAIASTGVTAATYGDATHVPQIAINAQGQATSASNVLITGTAPGGAAGGALTGTYPNPTLAAVVAGTSCATPSSLTYNDAGQVLSCTPGSTSFSAAFWGGTGSNGDILGIGTTYVDVPGKAAAAGSPRALYYVTRAGTISNLGMSLQTAPGGTDTVVVTAIKSSDRGATWSDTTLTCTITGAAFSCSDTSHAPAVAAGDWIGIKLVSNEALAAGPLGGMEAH